MFDAHRHKKDAHRHKKIATLRADGSPWDSDRGGLRARRGGVRLHGQAREGADLRRDPQFALHSAPVDPVEMNEAWLGRQISGRAVPAGPIEEPDGGRFYVDIHLSDMQHSQLGPVAVDTRAHTDSELDRASCSPHWMPCRLRVAVYFTDRTGNHAQIVEFWACAAA